MTEWGALHRIEKDSSDLMGARVNWLCMVYTHNYLKWTKEN